MITNEKCLENLRRVIDGRTMAICLPGYSINDQWDKIDRSLCLATVNDFWLIEEHLGNMDIAMCSAKECHVPTGRHIEFLERKEENLFITETVSFSHSLKECIEKYPDKLFFFVSEGQGVYPNFEGEGTTKENPLTFRALSSFSILTLLAIIGGAKQVVLFGADGGSTGKQLYIDDWGKGEKLANSLGRLLYDTAILNQVWPKVMKQVCDLYELEPIRIINCSLKSHLEVFEKLSYDDTLEVLNGS